MQAPHIAPPPEHRKQLNAGVAACNDRKIKNIEFLRVVLTLFIVIYHMFQKVHLGTYFPGWNHSTVTAEKAVEMFFVISGFLLLYTFNEKTDIFTVLQKKFIRFFPTIFFSYICMLVLSLVTDYSYHRYDSFYSLFFIDNIGITSRLGALTTWFISVLVFVSLFYSYLLKYFERKYTNLLIAVITLLSFSTLFYNTGGTLGGLVGVAPVSNATIPAFLNGGMLRGLSCMGLGYLLCCVYFYLKDSLQNYTATKLSFLVYSAAEIYLFIFLTYYMVFHKFHYDNNTLPVLYFTILLWLFIINRGLLSKIASSNVFSVMAKYTLAIFLTHLVVFKIFGYTVWKPELVINYPYLIVFLSFLCPVILGIAVYHFVEKPCMIYLTNRWLKSKNS